jgi:hypothetical protein
MPVRGQIASSGEFVMDFLETLFCDQDIDVFREAAHPVMKQRHTSNDCIRNPQLGQSLDDFAKGVEDRAFFLKVPATFAQGPPRILFERLLVIGYLRRILARASHICHIRPQRGRRRRHRGELAISSVNRRINRLAHAAPEAPRSTIGLRDVQTVAV